MEPNSVLLEAQAKAMLEKIAENPGWITSYATVVAIIQFTMLQNALFKHVRGSEQLHYTEGYAKQELNTLLASDPAKYGEKFITLLEALDPAPGRDIKPTLAILPALQFHLRQHTEQGRQALRGPQYGKGRYDQPYLAKEALVGSDSPDFDDDGTPSADWQKSADAISSALIAQGPALAAVPIPVPVQVPAPTHPEKNGVPAKKTRARFFSLKIKR